MKIDHRLREILTNIGYNYQRRHELAKKHGLKRPKTDEEMKKYFDWPSWYQASETVVSAWVVEVSTTFLDYYFDKRPPQGYLRQEDWGGICDLFVTREHSHYLFCLGAWGLRQNQSVPSYEGVVFGLSVTSNRLYAYAGLSALALAGLGAPPYFRLETMANYFSTTELTVGLKAAAERNSLNIALDNLRLMGRDNWLVEADQALIEALRKEGLIFNHPVCHERFILVDDRMQIDLKSRPPAVNLLAPLTKAEPKRIFDCVRRRLLDLIVNANWEVVSGARDDVREALRMGAPLVLTDYPPLVSETFYV